MTETANQSADGRSLHSRIQSDIADKITSGAWAPGHRIPFEHELTQQYGCSRMTVNKALTVLARAGLIERHRRAGSFVKSRQSEAAVLEIHDIRVEVEALGLEYRYVLASRRRHAADEAEAARLGIAAGEPVVKLACVHFAGERPFCHEDRLVSLDAVPDAGGEAFENTAPGPWLLTRVPWSAAEHRIMADAAGPVVAAALGLKPDAPVLVVERRTWSGEQPVTFVRLSYPAGAHALVARFAPAGDSQAAATTMISTR
ncbi:MAG: histidine utilization repressor [Rhizobiaceae bacterium]|nr:histidine utilization repressor [Rhizobiaceae bacterium]